MKRITLLILGMLVAACSAAAPQPTSTPEPSPTPDYAGLVITLSRTACFGTCPIYKLVVYGDGRVEYEGERFVAVTGSQSSTISPDQVRDLVAAFEQADYFNLKDDYTAPVTDLPTTITSVTFDGQTKTISNYGGCFELEGDEKAPQALCDFEARIDAVTNSAQWVGK
jgi:hypothetical protein